jgi:GNAT superfamily N-acetyltransferase
MIQLMRLTTPAAPTAAAGNLHAVECDMGSNVASFAILSSTRDPLTDAELVELLYRAYVDAGYTDPELAPVVFAPSAVRARGEIGFVRNAGDGRLAGMLLLVLPSSPARRFAGAEEVELHLLAVHPDQRRGGIARALVLDALEQARAAGYRRALLWTQPPMLAAQALYRSVGFVHVPARDFTSPAGRSFLFFERPL